MEIVNHLPELVANRFGGKDKINLTEVQRQTGLNYATVSDWVKGRVERADFPILAKWCFYLGVGVGDILEYRE